MLNIEGAMNYMKRFIKENGLSIVFFLLFLIAITEQALTGYRESLIDLMDENAEQITFFNYLKSGHFFQTTIENWESEFLQMALLGRGNS